MMFIPRMVLRNFLLLFSLAIFSTLTAQTNQADVALLAAHDKPVTANYNGRKDTINNRAPMVYENKSTIARINPLRWLATGSMFFYQQVLSPQINAGCLYQRTCSNYSKEAIRHFGIIRGVLLTADRLTRCTTSIIPEIESYRYDSHSHINDEPWHYFKK